MSREYTRRSLEQLLNDYEAAKTPTEDTFNDPEGASRLQETLRKYADMEVGNDEIVNPDSRDDMLGKVLERDTEHRVPETEEYKAVERGFDRVYNAPNMTEQLDSQGVMDYINKTPNMSYMDEEQSEGLREPASVEGYKTFEEAYAANPGGIEMVNGKPIYLKKVGDKFPDKPSKSNIKNFRKTKRILSKNKVDNFFKKQTSGVNLEGVSKELLNSIKKAAASMGESNITVSSGVRSAEKTKKLLNQNLKGSYKGSSYDLTKYKGNALKLAKKALLKEDKRYYTSKSNPKANWRKALREDGKKLGIDDKTLKKLESEIASARFNYGGLESAHMKGDKIDIPYSHFIDKYGEEDGKVKVEAFKKALEEQGIYIHDEPTQGRHGVLDLKLKKKKKK